MVVDETKLTNGELTSSWLGLITSVGAPLEAVVDSAETTNERGLHLMRELVAVYHPLY